MIIVAILPSNFRGRIMQKKRQITKQSIAMDCKLASLSLTCEFQQKPTPAPPLTSLRATMTKASPLKVRFTAGLAPSGLLRVREGINKTVIDNITHTHLAVPTTRHLYRATITTAYTQMQLLPVYTANP